MSGFSENMTEDMAKETDVNDYFRLGELPSGLLGSVLTKTSPLDVARLATVNRSFAEAARSDFVWRTFLPADADDVVKNAHGGPLAYDSIRGLYNRLGNHVLLGDGNEGYWIDRKTGGVHRSYSARTLGIIWGSTEEYWRWVHQEGSRFDEVAFLNSVCWLQIFGEINTRLPPGTYTLSWILKFSQGAYGFDYPITLSLTDGAQHNHKELRWSAWEENSWEEESEEAVWEGEAAWDEERHKETFSWGEYDVGNFTVEGGDDPRIGGTNLTFRMEEIARGSWKRGMYVDGVVIHPVTL